MENEGAQVHMRERAGIEWGGVQETSPLANKGCNQGPAKKE